MSRQPPRERSRRNTAIKIPTSTTTMIVLPNLLHSEGPSCCGADGTWVGIKSTKEGAIVPPGLIHQVQSTVPLKKDGQTTLGAGEHFHLCCGCGPAESHQQGPLLTQAPPFPSLGLNPLGLNILDFQKPALCREFS